jgi:hypothetical protein
MKRFKRASSIPSENVEVFYDTDDEDIVFRIWGTTGEEYMVSCLDGLWRCDCEDYVYAKDKQLGSYVCKHILKCIDYYFNEMRSVP